METKLGALKNKNVNSKILVEKAIKALLYEVNISPKAGLVTRESKGSHKDMDCETFKVSAFSLKNYFQKCFDCGKQYNLSNNNFFFYLRELGKQAEIDMFKATKGINTHKGTIFSMGILIGVLTAALKEKENLLLSDLVEYIKKVCKPLKLELQLKKNNTNGEKIFNKYGIKGARGLALSGYKIVLNDGLIKLNKFLEFLDLETSCILLLFYYISVLDDTNIISRSDVKTLEIVQKESLEIFSKYEKNLENSTDLIRNDMFLLNEKFVEKNISPGGSADLLILTIFLYFLMND